MSLHQNTSSSPGGVKTTLLYDRISYYLSDLIPQFGLENHREAIQHAYHLIASDALATPVGHRPPNISRINDDGVPFQFSLAMGHFAPPLQFLGEVIKTGHENSASRLAQSKTVLHDLAYDLGMQECLAAVIKCIDKMIPEDHPELLMEPAGALWIGVSFTPCEKPKLKLYLNMKWGTQMDRWKRLSDFAAHFNADTSWQTLVPFLNLHMEPLGVAITLSPDQAPQGRIYISAYGQRMEYYESLSKRSAHPVFQSLFRPYVETLLEEDYRYPTQSVVCSWGFNVTDGIGDFKFEMCAHHIFSHDDDAREKCLRWLNITGVRPTPYLELLETLSVNAPSHTQPRLHCYVGLGTKRDQIYSTVYFNPGTH